MIVLLSWHWHSGEDILFMSVYVFDMCVILVLEMPESPAHAAVVYLPRHFISCHLQGSKLS